MYDVLLDWSRRTPGHSVERMRPSADAPAPRGSPSPGSSYTWKSTRPAAAPSEVPGVTLGCGGPVDAGADAASSSRTLTAPKPNQSAIAARTGRQEQGDEDLTPMATARTQ